MDLSKISQIIIEVRARKEEACVMFPLLCNMPLILIID